MRSPGGNVPGFLRDTFATALRPERGAPKRTRTTSSFAGRAVAVFCPRCTPRIPCYFSKFSAFALISLRICIFPAPIYRDLQGGSQSPARRPSAPGLARHEHGERSVGEDVPGGAAEDHLPQSALGIGALDQQVALSHRRVRQDRFARAATLRRNGDGLA